MSAPANLWLELLPKNEDPDKPANMRRHDYCRKVLDLLAEKHHDLYAGKVGAVLTESEAQALVDTLKSKTPGHVFKHRISYLNSGLQKGVQELNWNVSIPQPPLVIPRDKPRFTLESFESPYLTFTQLSQHF